MKRILIFVPATLLSAQAFAADAIFEAPPEAPVPIIAETTGWSGLYVGVQGGYGFGDTGELEFDPLTPALDTAFFGPAGGGTGGEFDDGFVGGVHVGYDWQAGNVVFGGILDVVATDIEDEQFGISSTPATYTVARELDYLVTARARVGYAFGRFLPYITGGLAYGDVESRYFDTSGATVQSVREDDDGFGYTVGAGVEALVTDKVSFGLEYLYTDLGDSGATANLAGPAPGNPFGVIGGAGTNLSGSDDDFDFHTIQLKLSYRF